MSRNYSIKLAVFIAVLYIFQSLNIHISYAQETNRHQHRKGHHHNNQNGTLAGVILDTESHEPLPGANVLITGTYLGAATNHDGTFKISNLQPGMYRLKVSMMGFESIEKEVKISLNKTTSIEFELNPSVIKAEEVVVTATGVPQFYKDAPVKTSVVSRKLIQAQKANNLAEVLDFQTGVRVEQNCQNCNFTQVRLLGMEGHHTQVLIDSDPVISSLANVYGLEQFPDEMIEKVEIVKGGGSALYGGTAVAGVVNLITRRPTHNDIALDYRNGSINGDLDQKLGVTLARVNSKGNSSGYLFATMRNRDPWDANSDGFSEIGKLENQAVGLNWYYKPVINGELALQTHFIHEDRRGGNKFDLAPHKADIAEASETERYGGSLKWTHNPSALLDYKVFTSLALTNRDTYYGAEQDPNAYGESENPLVVTGAQANYLLSNHLLTAGVQYKQEKLKDIAVSYNRIIDETYTNLGLILQDMWKMDKNDQIELVYGSRIDKHSEINNAIFSPRAVMRWHITNPLTIRGGISTGFKPPQIFDEDLHITQVGGEGQIIRNSDDLEEERATTFYGGAEWTEILGTNGLRFSLNGFYTDLTKTFILDERDDPNTDEFEFYRANGDGSVVKGVEFEVGFRTRKAEITTGFTLQNSELDSPEPDFNSTHIFRTPDLYGSVRLSYDLSNKINLLGISKYTGPMYAPHYAGYIVQDRLEHTKSFVTFDLVASYKLPVMGHSYGTFSIGMYNITDSFQKDFDKGIARDAGYVYGPSVPRRLLIGFTLGH